MKRFKILFSVILTVVLLAACSPIGQGLVGLPDEGKTLVLMLVTAGLTVLFLWLFNQFGWDLGGYVQPLAAVLSPIVITVLEFYLALIPAQYDDIVTWIIHLLVLLLGSVGTVITFQRVKRKDSKNLLA